MAPHIYDYNYKVGESYYTPQTEYIDHRDLLRSRVIPPEAQTFAERFAERPIYGGTRGLPYDSSQAAVNKPLVNRRSVSASRARSREPDEDLSSSASRLGRGRDRERKVSFNMDDYLPRKFSLNDELDFQEPKRRYAKRTEKIASEEDFDINPRTRKELEDEFKRIRNEFKKADSLERGSVPRTTQYEDSVYNSDLGIPGRSRVKREEVSYTLPPSGSKVHKSIYSESSKFESTKPPRVPKLSRFSSIDNDVDFKLPKTTRIRNFSIGDMDDNEFDLKFKASRPKSRDRILEDEKFQQSLSLRERRRNEESEQLSENISHLINKMKNHAVEDGGYKFTRTIRASSLDPYEREPRVKSRLQARAHNFSYGVSK